MKTGYFFLIAAAALIAAVAVGGCGKSSIEGDADAVDNPPDEDAQEDALEATPDEVTAEDATAEDPPQEPPPETPPEMEEQDLEDVPTDTIEEEDGGSGMDRLGTNNQDISGVQRVIFLGDSITATPYLTSPWSDLIRPDLRTLYGSGVEFRNYAAWGARTEDVRDDQLPSIDTASTKKTLVLMTVGGNDALQVIGEAADVSLAHMETKVAILEEIIQWIIDPAHFPGGVYLVYGNMYDPTDGVGDFTHCGLGAGYEDWPALPEIEPVANGWFLDLAMTYGVDMLDMHGLFLGHGYHNNDTANPWYCHDCEPDCPCPRWFDLTCIHPNSDGHPALAGFFLGIITR